MAIIGDNFPNVLDGTNGGDVFIGMRGNDTLNGFGGFDYADFSDHVGNASLTAGWNINLLTGKATTSYTSSFGNFGIVFFTETDTLNSIEAAFGSAKSDTFTINDTMSAYGRLGNDTANIVASSSKSIALFDGGGDTDTANFSGVGTAISVNLDNVSPFISVANVTTADPVTGGLAKLRDVENVTGTNFSDVLRGNAGANVLDGGLGNDRFVMSPVQSSLAPDTYLGGVGGDFVDARLSGRALEFYIIEDFVEDGASVGYQSNPTTFVKLASLKSVENVIGSNFGDFIWGGGMSNSFDGGKGNDDILGGDGIDTITGGLGADFLIGSSNGSIEGQPPRDSFADSFVYRSIADSGTTATTWDEIADFNGNDLINLRNIDARAGTIANDNFAFVGKVSGASITANGVGGRVAYYQSGGDTYVGVEVNGDTRFDSIIKLDGLITLNTADFIL